MTTDAWRELLAVNQDGAFYMMREGARHMKQRFDAGDPGRIAVVLREPVGADR